MKTSLIASVITFCIVGALITAKAIMDSKGLFHIFEGIVLFGGIIALGTLIISLAGGYITKNKKLAWPTFLLLSMLFGILLWVWNVYTLSNEMSINTELAAKQILFFIVVGVAVGGVAYVCHKVRT